MAWDCKHKIDPDGCRLRKAGCFPGGRGCVLKGKFEFPLRQEVDELEKSPKKKRKKV